MDAKSLEKYFAAKLEAEWGPFDLKKRAGDEKIVVLDTRSIESYRREHIPGAINIPADEIGSRSLEALRRKTVVCYCWNVTCHSATRVALALAREGYDVKELVGGIEEWKKAGFPVEKSEMAVV